MRSASSLVLLALLGLTACSRSWEHESAIAKSSSGRWQRAWTKVEYSPSHHKGGQDFPASLVHWLTIERDDDVNKLNIILGQWDEATHAHDFKRLSVLEDTLRFAPDGHAIALSSDAGKSHWVFDLTPATEALTVPFYCTHRRFETLDPWPDTRAVVLEVLDETSGNAATHVHDAPTSRTDPVAPNDGELLDASLYACARIQSGVEATDPRMQKALLDAFVAPWKKWVSGRGGDDSTLQKCITAIALREPTVLARLRAAQDVLAAQTRDWNRVRDALYFVDNPERR